VVKKQELVVMKIKGTVFKYGEDVNTDEIIPARYLNTSDPVELAKHLMEDGTETEGKDIVATVKPGDVVVAGKNFGCGSSREHAPIALKAAGIGCVVAVTFARIFYRNAINIGLPILECPEAAAAIKSGDKVAIDLAAGTITRGQDTFNAEPFPDFMQELIAAGGLIPYTMAKQNEG